MRFARRPTPKTLGGLATASVVVVVLIACAVATPRSSAKYRLDGAAVWVTNGGAIGRLNSEIAQIDYTTPEAQGTVEVVQDGAAVYKVVSEGGGEAVRRLDPVNPTADADPFQLPARAPVAAGGGQVYALANRKLVVVDLSDEGSTRVVAPVAKDALLAAGPGGAAAYSGTTGQMIVLGSGSSRPKTSDWPKVGSDASLTMVGSVPVVLDSTGQRLLLPGRDPVPLTDRGGSLVLQRPGPAADAVIVASQNELLSVSISTGDVSEVHRAEGGEPLEPATGDGCVLGGWQGAPGQAVAVCGARTSTLALRNGDWTTRTGGPAPVFNDRQTGDAVQALEGELKLVKWPTDDQPNEESGKTAPIIPNPEGKTPPVAVPDVYAVKHFARIGKKSLVSVLKNDYDADGDVVYIDQLRSEDGAPVEIAPDRRAVTIDLTDVAQVGRPFRFRYRISDGGPKLSNWADAEVEAIRADDPGHSPLQFDSTTTLTVEAGTRADVDALSGWWDPDGDPMFLVNATGGGDGQVTFDTDGSVHLVAGQRPGRADVQVRVGDQYHLLGQEGPLPVLVKAEPVDPTLRNDLRVLVVGHEYTFSPLDNDSLALNGDFRLLGLPRAVSGSLPPGSMRLTDDGRALRLAPTHEGTVKLVYRVEDGLKAFPDRAVLLLKVIPSTETPPVYPVDDIAFVRVGRDAEVDLAQNDQDVLGRALSIVDFKSISSDEGNVIAGVESDYVTMRIEATDGAEPAALDGSSTRGVSQYSYSVVGDDGQDSATATVTVVVLNPVERQRLVRAPESTVVVRAGDVATIPASAFATAPDGDPIGLDLRRQPVSGSAAVSGDSVRYFAPATPPASPVSIDVRVSQLAQPTQPTLPASVLVRVVGEGANHRPVAPDLVARTRRGRTTHIPVPEAGTDPDGDTVRLLETSPERLPIGVLTSSEQTQELTYTAPDRNTLDHFTYRLGEVRPQHGGGSSPAGLLTVAVTKTDRNHSPVPITDRAFARPGGTTWINPLANDLDLDGDPLQIARGSVKVIAGGCHPVQEGGGVKISLDAGNECAVAYGVVDAGKSAPVLGRISVTAVVGFAGYRPIAHDDFAVVTHDDPHVARASVLANDSDPDGPLTDVRVRLTGPRMSGISLNRRGVLSAALTSKPRMVRYQLTDGGGLDAEAVVWIPARQANRPPELVPGADALKVRAGASIPVQLDRYIRDPEGKKLEISDVQSVAVPLDTLRRRLADGIVVFAPRLNTPPGPSSFQVTASDGRLSRVLTIPVEVLPKENVAPSWGAVAIDVYQDESATIDLAQYVTDPDAGDQAQLRYTVTGDPRGRLSREGLRAVPVGRSGLRVSATADTAVGTFTVPMAAVDPHGNRAAGDVEIAVHPFRKEDLVAAAVEETVHQDVHVDIDLHPYVENVEGSLKTVDVQPLSAGDYKVGIVPGGKISFQSGKTFAGEVSLRYTVGDDADAANNIHRASSKVTVLVQGRPDPPTNLIATSPRGQTVDLTWVDGSSNFADIKGYVVSDTAHGISKNCKQNPCEMTAADGIKNAVTYVFRVKAVNEVDASDLSKPSEAVTPDVPPDKPLHLDGRVSPVDDQHTVGTVTFLWSPAHTSGSEVVGYAITYEGDATGESNFVKDGQTVTAHGPNGIPLCIQVRARNSATSNGGLSEPARACKVPYGHPIIHDPQAAPGANPNTTLVTWGSDANGEGPQTWTLKGCGTSRDGSGPSGNEPLTTCDPGDTVTLAVTNGNDQTTKTDIKVKVFVAPTLTTNPPDVRLTVGAFQVANAPSRCPASGCFPGSLLKNPGGENVQITWHVFFATQGGAPQEVGVLGADGFLPGIVDQWAWTTVDVTLQACNGKTCSKGVSREKQDVTPYTSATNVTITGTAPHPDDGTRTDISFSWDPPSSASGTSQHHYKIVVVVDGVKSTQDLAPGAGVITVLNPSTGSFTYRVRDVDADDATTQFSTYP
jgi:hypothetical protein